MTELAKRESAPIFTDGWDDTAAEAESRVIRGSLLKFADWKWFIGKDKEVTEVKKDRQLVAVATAAAWVKWQGGKPMEYRLREPGVPMPERGELGDNDTAEWEIGPDGQPRDAWQSTHFVYLIDPQTAEAFTFSTSSWGGRDCVINLADQIRRMRGTHSDAVPLVRLGAAPMSTRFGRKSKPTLTVVGWRTTAASAVIGQPERQLPPAGAIATREPVAAKPVDDMDDDIPF
jgi:hypothetical protein